MLVDVGVVWFELRFLVDDVGWLLLVDYCLVAAWLLLVLFGCYFVVGGVVAVDAIAGVRFSLCFCVVC